MTDQLERDDELVRRLARTYHAIEPSGTDPHAAWTAAQRSHRARRAVAIGVGSLAVVGAALATPVVLESLPASNSSGHTPAASAQPSPSLHCETGETIGISDYYDDGAVGSPSPRDAVMELLERRSDAGGHLELVRIDSPEDAPKFLLVNDKGEGVESFTAVELSGGWVVETTRICARS